MNKKRSLVIGSGQLALNCVKILLQENYEVKVYEYNAFEMSLLKKRCDGLCVEYHAFGKKELTETLLQILNPMLIVSANNTYILPIEVIRNKNIVAINYHPALLPLYPGRNAECWSIYNMDEFAGVTWHFINENIDQGEIIEQERIEIQQKDTSLALMLKQFILGTKLFEKIINNISLWGVDGLETKPNITKKEDLHYSFEAPNGGCLDIEWSVDKMYAFCRAMDYGKLKVLGDPFCEYGGRRYVWNKYRIEDNEDKLKTNILEGIFANEKKIIILEGWHLK